MAGAPAPVSEGLGVHKWGICSPTRLPLEKGLGNVPHDVQMPRVRSGASRAVGTPGADATIMGCATHNPCSAQTPMFYTTFLWHAPAKWPNVKQLHSARPEHFQKIVSPQNVSPDVYPSRGIAPALHPKTYASNMEDFFREKTA